eukprot:jgi/Bigna1/140335/aug1.55_g15043
MYCVSDAEQVTITNLIDVCSVFALGILESILDCDIEGVIQTPLFMSDHEHNARLCVRVIKSVVPGISLDHIQSKAVSNGDVETCLNMLEIVCETAEAVLRYQTREQKEMEDIGQLLADDGSPNEEVDPNEARALSEIEALEESGEHDLDTSEYTNDENRNYGNDDARHRYQHHRHPNDDNYPSHPQQQQHGSDEYRQGAVGEDDDDEDAGAKRQDQKEQESETVIPHLLLSEVKNGGEKALRMMKATKKKNKKKKKKSMQKKPRRVLGSRVKTVALRGRFHAGGRHPSLLGVSRRPKYVQ